MYKTKHTRTFTDTDVKTPDTNDANPFAMMPPEVVAMIVNNFETTNDIKALRLVCKQFRGILSLLRRGWFDRKEPIDYHVAINYSLLSPASLRKVWPNGLCPRTINFTVNGTIANDVLQLSLRSKERVHVCAVVKNEVKAPLAVTINVGIDSATDIKPGCRLGKCLAKVADAVFQLDVVGLPGTLDDGLLIDQVFSNAALVRLSGVKHSNFDAVFPSALKYEVAVTPFNVDAKTKKRRWTVPEVLRPSLYFVASGADTIEVTENAEVREFRLKDAKTLVATADATVTASRVVFNDTGVPALESTSDAPVMDTAELAVIGNHLTASFLNDIGKLFVLSSLTSVQLWHVRMPSANFLARFPETVTHLNVSMCTSDDPMCYDSLKPTVKDVRIKWNQNQSDAVCIDFSVPGVLGTGCEGLYIETVDAVLPFRVDLTNATGLTSFYAEGFRRGIDLTIPGDVPLTSFGIGEKTHARLGPRVRPDEVKVPLKRVMVLTTQNVGDVACFVTMRTKNFKELETTMSANAFVALLPTIFEARTPAIATWLRDSVTMSISSCVKPLCSVVLACIYRRQVMQEDVSKVDIDFLRMLVYLYPRSFQNTYRSETIAVHPADTWVCSRPEKFNGAPPVIKRRNVRGIHPGTGHGIRIEICPTDVFVPLYTMPNGYRVYSRVIQLAFDTPKDATIEDSVEALYMKRVITQATAKSLTTIFFTTTPDALDVHSQIGITQHVSGLMRPVVIARAKRLPGIEALDETACGGAKLADTPEGLTRLVERHAGYGPGFANLVIVTGAQPAEPDLLAALKLAPTRPSAVRTKTVAITDVDFNAANIVHRIKGNMCGMVRWVVMQNVKQGASNDAILTAYCSAIHLCANVGPV